MLWLAWIVVAMVALGGELLTGGLFLASFAVAALIAAALSVAAPLAFQIGVFGVLSVLLLVGVRPAALRLLPTSSAEQAVPRVGPVGQHGVAVESINQRRGQIRMGASEFWSARADGDISIPPGSEVLVLRMQGLVAVVEPVTSSAAAPEADSAIPFSLSPREVEVLRLVALGMSNQEIAERLYLSPRTVHHHVSHILDKMGADNRVEAVRRAIEAGIVRADES
jgi:DNA-binding CsgD family transcriptional regulator/membrane protein implicated in regulation of membrane protease activity